MDALQILIQLKDLSEGAFKKVEGNLTHLEQKANATNLSGASKAMKRVEQDAAGAGGKSGVGSLIGGLTGLVNPAMLAATALGVLVGILGNAAATSESVEKQEKTLDAAYRAHGSTLEEQRGYIEATIKANEAYGRGADETRGAILELVQAGHSQADVTASMPAILMLAQQKHLDLATAAKQVQLAEMGNAKALKDLGIALPKPTAATKELTSATKGADAAHKSLTNAQNALKLMQDGLVGKTKLTTAEALRLKIAQDKVKAATDADSLAKARLTKAQDASAKSGGMQREVLDALRKALGENLIASSPLDRAQAKLGDTWQKLAVVIGPPLLGLFSGLIDLIANIVGKLADFVSWIGKAGEAVMNSPIGGFIKSVGGFLGGVGGAVGGLLGNLPHFAGGGVVDRPTLAIIGEGGQREHIIPESKLGGYGGGGRTVVVQSHIYLDGREISESVDRHLGATLALRGTSMRTGMAGV